MTEQNIILDQVSKVKLHMLENFHKKYNDFITSIRILPISDQAKNNAIHFFDTGCLWFREGIVNLKHDSPPLNPIPPKIDTDQPPHAA